MYEYITNAFPLKPEGEPKGSYLMLSNSQGLFLSLTVQKTKIQLYKLRPCTTRSLTRDCTSHWLAYR